MGERILLEDEARDLISRFLMKIGQHDSNLLLDHGIDIFKKPSVYYKRGDFTNKFYDPSSILTDDDLVLVINLCDSIKTINVYYLVSDEFFCKIMNDLKDQIIEWKINNNMEIDYSHLKYPKDITDKLLLNPGKSTEHIILPDQIARDFLNIVDKVLMLISAGFTGGYLDYYEWSKGWKKPGTYLKALTWVNPDDWDWCIFNSNWKNRKIFNITTLYNCFNDLNQWFLKIMNEFRHHNSTIFNFIDGILPIITSVTIHTKH